MVINGIGMISNEYSAQDYIELNLCESSDETTWEKAIEMFSDRFEERYFEPIRKLSVDGEKYGFSIMAINCLLIDTFYQFINGKNRTDNNADCYKRFLLETFPMIFVDDKLAHFFYRDIRCGILHQAQTKGTSVLTCENECIIERAGNNGVKVNVHMFSIMLFDFFNKYKKCLLNSDKEKRINFIKKMNYICRYE